jgi:hypothetical protein
VPFSRRYSYCAVFLQEIIFCAIFKGGFSVCTKKYIKGFFSVRFFFRRVSFCAIFKGNIWILSVFFSCRFNEGISWDSHSEYQAFNPCHSPPVEENARITVQCSARKRAKTRPLFLHTNKLEKTAENSRAPIYICGGTNSTRPIFLPHPPPPPPTLFHTQPIAFH